MSVTRPDPPLPVVDDVDTGGHWEALACHELAIRACATCGQVLHVPKAYCHACGGWSTEWRVVAPRGTLYSWTTVFRQIHPAFPAPYTIVLVEVTDLPGAVDRPPSWGTRSRGRHGDGGDVRGLR